jgi:large subunit ribosomal protein L30
MAGRKIRIILRKSLIGRKPKQRKTARALGLGKIDSRVEHEANPSILGMVNTISHLVQVEEIE